MENIGADTHAKHKTKGKKIAIKFYLVTNMI